MIPAKRTRTRRDIADRIRITQAVGTAERAMRGVDWIANELGHPILDELEALEARVAMLEFVGGAEADKLDALQIGRDLELPRVAPEAR